MGRKSSRNLWTAKLAGSLPAGSDAVVPHSGAAARVPIAAKDITGATAAPAPSLPASRPAAAARAREAAREAASVAKIGQRLPFHGVVLGIDPSLRGTGLAVVRFSPPQQPRLLFSTTVKNRPALTAHECLGAIASAVTAVLETYQPACVALEQTVYVQNVKTSLILGSARGAAIAPAAMQGLEVFEYAPLRLKQAVVGHGRASKEQVAAMVKSLLEAGRDLLPSDEADAAAAAICHAFTFRR